MEFLSVHLLAGADLQPLTSVESINELTVKQAHTWVGYYVGRWACIGLELDQARKALRLAVGLCA